MSEQAKRYNKGKTMLSIITPEFTEGLGKVLTMGAEKYGRNNWRKGLKVTEIIDSLERHLLEIKKGVALDEESGLPHWAHAAANLMFIAEFEGSEKWDDRVYSGRKREREDGEGYAKGGGETIIIKGVTSGDREADTYDVSQTR